MKKHKSNKNLNYFLASVIALISVVTVLLIISNYIATRPQEPDDSSASVMPTANFKTECVPQQTAQTPLSFKMITTNIVPADKFEMSEWQLCLYPASNTNHQKIYTNFFGSKATYKSSETGIPQSACYRLGNKNTYLRPGNDYITHGFDSGITGSTGNATNEIDYGNGTIKKSLTELSNWINNSANGVNKNTTFPTKMILKAGGVINDQIASPNQIKIHPTACLVTQNSPTPTVTLSPTPSTPIPTDALNYIRSYYTSEKNIYWQKCDVNQNSSQDSVTYGKCTPFKKVSISLLNEKNVNNELVEFQKLDVRSVNFMNFKAKDGTSKVSIKILVDNNKLYWRNCSTNNANELNCSADDKWSVLDQKGLNLGQVTMNSYDSTTYSKNNETRILETIITGDKKEIKYLDCKLNDVNGNADLTNCLPGGWIGREVKNINFNNNDQVGDDVQTIMSVDQYVQFYNKQVYFRGTFIKDLDKEKYYTILCPQDAYLNNVSLCQVSPINSKFSEASYSGTGLVLTGTERVLSVDGMYSTVKGIGFLPTETPVTITPTVTLTPTLTPTATPILSKCGPVDVNNDGVLSLVDLANRTSEYSYGFAYYYGENMKCEDTEEDYESYGPCGGKNYNYQITQGTDKILNVLDLSAFSHRYRLNPVKCDLNDLPSNFFN